MVINNDIVLITIDPTTMYPNFKDTTILSFKNKSVKVNYMR